MSITTDCIAFLSVVFYAANGTFLAATVNVDLPNNGPTRTAQARRFHSITTAMCRVLARLC